MFCSQCGKEIKDGSRFCPECGAPIIDQAQNQGFAQRNQEQKGYTYTPPTPSAAQASGYREEQPRKSTRTKLAAGLLGIFLGGFGVHNFYLGRTTRGIVQLVLTLCSCGIAGIWGFIEGILCLCGQMTDGDGLPLSD